MPPKKCDHYFIQNT